MIIRRQDLATKYDKQNTACGRKRFLARRPRSSSGFGQRVYCCRRTVDVQRTTWVFPDGMGVATSHRIARSPPSCSDTAEHWQSAVDIDRGPLSLPDLQATSPVPSRKVRIAHPHTARRRTNWRSCAKKKEEEEEEKKIPSWSSLPPPTTHRQPCMSRCSNHPHSSSGMGLHLEPVDGRSACSPAHTGDGNFPMDHRHSRGLSSSLHLPQAGQAPPRQNPPGDCRGM